MAEGTGVADEPDVVEAVGAAETAGAAEGAAVTEAVGAGEASDFAEPAGMAEGPGVAASRTVVPVVRESDGLTITLSD